MSASRFLDMTGQPIQAGDVVLVDNPGSECKVIGVVEYNARRRTWRVRVKKAFSATQQRFVYVGGYVPSYVAIVPRWRLGKRLRRVEVLQEKRTSLLFETPEIPCRIPVPQRTTNSAE